MLLSAHQIGSVHKFTMGESSGIPDPSRGRACWTFGIILMSSKFLSSYVAIDFSSSSKNPTRSASLPTSNLQASQTASQQPAVLQSTSYRATIRGSTDNTPASQAASSQAGGTKKPSFFIMCFTSFLNNLLIFFGTSF